MKAKTVKEVLIAAKWILDNVGWCQKSYYKTKSGVGRSDVMIASTHGDVGCACALGSIYLVDVDNVSLHEQAIDVLHGVLEKSLTNLSTNDSVANWNDNHNRTKKEVQKLFTQAIKKAK